MATQTTPQVHPESTGAALAGQGLAPTGRVHWNLGSAVLIEQAVRPLARSAAGDDPVVAETAARLAELSARVHALLLGEALRESRVLL